MVRDINSTHCLSQVDSSSSIDQATGSESSQKSDLEDPLVSIIIVNWNGSAVLPNCLKSLKVQTYDNWELIIIDNASRDNSIEIIKEYFPNCSLIKLETNLGFAAGNNLGIESARGEYVILLNNDTEVQKTFIRSLVSEAERDPAIASVGCKIAQYDGSIRYGPVYTVEGGIIYGRRLSDLFSSTPKSYLHLRYPSSVVANCGCAVLYRKSVLDVIGSFDILLRSNWEDHDLGLRLNLGGNILTYIPYTTVMHVGGHSEGSNIDLGRFSLIIRNTLITYYKNLELPNTFTKIPLVVVLYVGFGIKEWLGRRANKWTPIIVLSGVAKGFFSFLRVFHEVQKRRNLVQRIRVISDKELFRRTAIPRRSLWKDK